MPSDAGALDTGAVDAGPMDTGPVDAGPGCIATVEICNGTDDDCDGFADESLSRACDTACGAGLEVCSGGGFTGCTAATPTAETCDGSDQDCDGAVDEGLSRACSSACGGGTETCQAGSWIDCDAPVPATETCNSVDDDCDSRTDEGLAADIFDPVPMSELTAAQASCDGAGGRIDVCMSAASRWCAARAFGCYVSGAGHLQATATGARVACFGSGASRSSVTRSDIAVASGITLTDTTITQRLAQSAVNRYCRSVGFEAGVGPVEHANPAVAVVCLPSSLASYRSIATSELTGRGCDPVGTDPSTLICSSAADSTCRAAGFAAGVGPVEWNASMSAVVCLRD
jgi:hypothetical protein